MKMQNGLFIDTLDYKYMIDLKKDSIEDTLKTIKSVFDQREQLKDVIQSRLCGVVEEKKQLLYQDLSKFMQL